MERTASVEDLVGNLWRAGLGRTPSQAEFEHFLNVASHGSQQNLAEAEQSNANGIPRVASIDFLRKMIMNQQMMQAGGQAGVPTMLPPHAANPAVANPAAAFAAFMPPTSVPLAPKAIHNAAAEWAKQAGSADGTVEAAPAGNLTEPAKPTPVPAPAPKETKTKAPPAKRQKTTKTPTPPPVAAPESKLDDGDMSDDDGSDSGKEDAAEALKTGKTQDEVRRQRRMLSNRESARRSRRRKLEHVATLEGQINNLRSENDTLVQRLREVEQRCESALRENAGLKADVERLNGQIREVSFANGKMERSTSLQRISSSEHLAKRGRDQLDSPRIGGDDSPRGFVPFRSLQSYENLLSLQVQAQAR